jgi:hypothetical protein
MVLVAEIHSRVLVLLKHYGTFPLHHVLAKAVKVPPVNFRRAKRHSFWNA